MFIRTTRFQVKQRSIAKFDELAEHARARSASLEGVLQSFVAMSKSGAGVLVAIWESKEKADASMSVIKANWADVMEHMDGQPQVDEYINAAKVKG